MGTQSVCDSQAENTYHSSHDSHSRTQACADHTQAKHQGATIVLEGGFCGSLKERERMSAAKLIMDADPSAKPWLLSRSISNTSIKEDILVTARERNMSRDREESSEISED